MRYSNIKSEGFSIHSLYLTNFTMVGTYKHVGDPRVFVGKFRGEQISNPIPLKYRNKIRNKYYEAKHVVGRQLSRLDRRTQYYINSGTDCDGVSSSRAVKFESAFGALESIDASYEWADGPEYWTKCTKEDYENYEATYRDYGMEAYEDGHAHCRYG